MLNYPGVCLEIKAFSTYLFGRQLFASTYTFSPAKAISSHLSQNPLKKGQWCHSTTSVASLKFWGNKC